MLGLVPTAAEHGSALHDEVPMFRLLLPLAALAVAACTHLPAVNPAPLPWDRSGQMVVVTASDWNATRGVLRRFQRDAAGRWQPVGDAQPIVVGRNGSGWGFGLNPAPDAGIASITAGDPIKAEGDGRAPAGVFAIGTAFGYAGSADTAMPYQAMDAGDWCIDVSGSPLYNRIVDVDDVGQAAVEGSTEPMRRDLHADGDQRYRLGFVIEHNPKALPMAGSCIFAHLWKTPDTPTAGCTAMAPATMDAVLGWLDPAEHPVFVLLPDSEYRELRARWRLPELPR
jgi:L,D-peptidoglycan transpeptidase YkuD (ErfK/YbiS/YcfS/YnhG family)